MIQAVLGSKSAGCEYSEDMLTSTVFGALRYLPKEVLISFLESSFIYNGERLKLWKHLRDDRYELRGYRKIKYCFWPRHKKNGEPDLILLFSDHVHEQADLMLLIEVKFKSEKSSTGKNDQLKKYYEAIKFNLSEFNESEISNFKGEKKYFLYLTEADAHLEIEESLKELKKSHANFSDYIFHLRWQQLFKILESNHSNLSSTDKIILEDLMDFLKNIGLRDFAGITLPDKKLQDKVQGTHPIFYFKQPVLTIESFHTYFKKLTKVNIPNHKPIFFRRVINE